VTSYKVFAEVEFTGGGIVRVGSDVADDAYVDVEQHLAAAMARD
jgi:arylsulfatase